MPHVAGLGGVARALVAAAVKNVIVCIDDLERKGRNISMSEVMGTIAELRDARQSKVVLILNENSLSAPEREAFRGLSDKVINFTFRFEPTAADAAAIAYPGEDILDTVLNEATQALGVQNLRVLQKIRHYGRQLLDLLQGVDQAVVRTALRTMVVVCWAQLSPEGEGAPSLDFLQSMGNGPVPPSVTRSPPARPKPGR